MSTKTEIPQIEGELTNKQLDQILDRMQRYSESYAVVLKAVLAKETTWKS